jgi:DNA mismatch repair protein MutS2
VEQPIERQVVDAGGPAAYRAIRLGDKVRVLTINAQGVVTGLGQEDAEVQVGMLRIRARLSELQPWSASSDEAQAASARARKRKEPVESKPKADFSLPVSPGIELDLRGQRADDALDAMERYLDSAYLAGLPFVRIIHGKGTGKLRQAVRETLSQHPHVKSFESGSEKEGGEGVTVVKLRT